MALSGHAVPQLPGRKQPWQWYDSSNLRAALWGSASEKSLTKGESYGLDKSCFRRSCSLLRNQLLRERKTLNLQKEDAHSDPRFCGRG